MGPRTKKVLGWLFVAFIIYFIWSAPTRAGNAVQSAIDIAFQGVDSLFTFFNAIVT